MTRRSLRQTPLVLLLWALFAAVSHAADLTAFAGGVRPGSLSTQAIQGAVTKQEFGNSAIFGFRLRMGGVPLLGFEHTLGFSSDFLFPKDLPSIANVKGFVYNSNLIIDVPLGKAVPYATAGLGLIRQYGSNQSPVGTKFAFNYGGGVKLPNLFGPLGLRLDARGYTATGIFSTQLNLLELSAGILLTFGR